MVIKRSIGRLFIQFLNSSDPLDFLFRLRTYLSEAVNFLLVIFSLRALLGNLEVQRFTMADIDLSGVINGQKMSPPQMRDFLQYQLGVPVALRNAVTQEILCPYCHQQHFHDQSEIGYTRALCGEEYAEATVTINEREFIPNYGYILFDFKLKPDGTAFQISGS